MATGLDEKIALTFVEHGVLSAEKLGQSQQLAAETGEALSTVLLREGYLTQAELLTAYGEELGIEFRETLYDVAVPPEFVRLVPVHFARSHRLIGISKDNGRMLVATDEPLDIQPLDDLAVMLGLEVEPVLAPETEIVSLIGRVYEQGSEVVDGVLEELTEEDIGGIALEVEGSEDLLDMANKAPIIRLVNTLLFQAVKMRASDVHIQPYEDRFVVRYRIDGVLHDVMTPPKKIQEAVISRVKVMGDMDIAERRFPQDGRTTVKVSDREIDLRISSIPTSHGERVVMRLLDKSTGLLDIAQIGLTPQDIGLVENLITFPHGILFVTGPTGSGKTTTLYAALARINTTDKNIITIEDPIEYQLAGVSQMEVNEKKGLTFAEGLRSVLRQDPDVLMVGEVRDFDTATTAIQSSLTGHLVFSTLHTNDAPSATTRMLDIGVEPYLVSSSVIAVMAQRLVRLICPKCKEPYPAEEGHIKPIGLSMADLTDGTLWRGKGCDECMGTGYKERTGIYEIMLLDDAIRDQIMTRQGASGIKKGAIERGMRTLRMDGAAKVAKGLTTVEEVLRVTQMDVF